MEKRLEVRIEELLINTFPSMLDEDPAGGQLAQSVVEILRLAIPTYIPYQEDED